MHELIAGEIADAAERDAGLWLNAANSAELSAWLSRTREWLRAVADRREPTETAEQLLGGLP